MTKKKVVAYIDGFNVYHSIANNLPEKYKWLDYRAFVEQFIWPDEELSEILFFTAEPRWDILKIARHNEYLDILKQYLKIHIVSGNYTSVSRTFTLWKNPVIDPLNAIVDPSRFTYKTYEEKQTDVNIALAIFEGAMTDTYDTAIIFSGDSDIAPAIFKSRKYKPHKKFICVLPYKGRGQVIARSCDDHKNTTLPILENCLLPDEITLRGNIYKNPYKK